MEMNQPGNGRGLPPTITVSSGPWAGVYTRDADASGLYSYWGPAPGGTVRRTEGLAFIKPEYATPTLHFSVHPDDADGSIHVSLDVSRDRGEKFAHLFFSDWDVRALDDRSFDWAMAADETHPGALFAALQEASGQITAFRGLNDYDHQRAKYAGDESHYFQIDPGYPAADGQPQPVGTPSESGYLDEMDGENLTFAMSDASNNSRSLTIERSLLESAAGGQIQLPYSATWVTVKWAGREATLPDTLFTVT